MKKNLKIPRWTLAFTAAAIILLHFTLPVWADDSGNVSYAVRFVDCEDHQKTIFNTQRGSIPEGTILSIRFPEQLIGSDGYSWKSVVESPQAVEINQSGTHKYYIEYKRGEPIVRPENPDHSGEKELKKWIQTTWKADCAVTGENPEERPIPHLVVSDTEQNNRRIRTMVTIIEDAEWHYFYMIGKNYVPETSMIGTSFDAQYSSVEETKFQIGQDQYVVIKIGIMRKWKKENCSHNWEKIGKIANTCIQNGQETYYCGKCGTEETVFLPALGHFDSNHDLLCDRCFKANMEEPAEKHTWKKGDIVIRQIGKKQYRFYCVDEDYSDYMDAHQKTALFLCDSVIRSDQRPFGADNNYKTSETRKWLTNHAHDLLFNMQPISIGVNTAYLGCTEARTWDQLNRACLIRHEIGFQLMQDQIFCLSLEEAMKYKDNLWKFCGANENNPKSQISPYSSGYYLRTPAYDEDENGSFQYSDDIYIVDLELGNIHTVKVGETSVGIRPAFALPQE
ncbi:MAG: hypothetical protein RSE05_07305 [Clostridium sp.]